MPMKPFDIQFDAQARRSYLTSFSVKKKQRRAFGLAMQKVKDRREKLDQRKEHRKQRMNEDESEECPSSSMDPLLQDSAQLVLEDSVEIGDHAPTITTTFVDPLTHATFGGPVIVTTTFDILHEPMDDPEKEEQEESKGVDTEQRFAGSVKKYLNDKLPSKKRKNGSSGGGGGTSRKKGKHGAMGMKGLGSTMDFKLAQKTLKQAKSKLGHASNSHGKKFGGNKNQKGKGGRR
jgi:hypothetical protein